MKLLEIDVDQCENRVARGAKVLKAVADRLGGLDVREWFLHAGTLIGLGIGHPILKQPGAAFSAMRGTALAPSP